MNNFKKTIYLKDIYFPFTYINHTREIVRCILVNDKNEIALHNVVRNDDFGNASYYETPGGGVKNEENLIDALKREMLEEVGASIKDIKPLMIVDDYYNLIHRHNINYFYIAKVEKYYSVNLQKGGDELIAKTIWVDINKALDLYKSCVDLPITKIVKNREIPILEFAKSFIDNKKI